MTEAERLLPHVTCLGCGCACDDIHLTVRDNRIVEARNACELGAAWFDGGRVPWRVLAGGREAPMSEAIEAVAAMLTRASRPVVYLAPELTCEAQRAGVALADRLRAGVDSVTSATAIDSLLAAQERGRAAATLGEIRNRADLLVWWGVDPRLRYPRYASRYAPEPAGVHVPDGRRSRTVVAVDVGDARGPQDADHRFALSAHAEIDMLTALRAAVVDGQSGGVALAQAAGSLAALFRAARYAVIVADVEPAGEVRRGIDRTGALIEVAQAFNGPTRCALSLLRAGGNRSGADAVLTWQTGYPAAVDFARGYPRYRPHDGGLDARLSRHEVDAVLVLGAAALVPERVTRMLAGVSVAAIGPRVSESAFARAVAAIDTGVAGIHEGGMALRMDDVPLPLRPSLDAPIDTLSIARALSERIVTQQGLVGRDQSPS